MSGLVIGVDPGQDGGAVLMTPRLVVDGVLRWKETREDDGFSKLFEWAEMGAVCFIEKVHSSGVQRPKAAFTFGGNFHSWGTALKIFEIPTVKVIDQEWQHDLVEAGEFKIGLERKDRKSLLYDICKSRYPCRLKQLADAYLIAEYGVKHYAEFFVTAKSWKPRDDERVSLGF